MLLCFINSEHKSVTQSCLAFSLFAQSCKTPKTRSDKLEVRVLANVLEIHKDSSKVAGSIRS